MMLERKAVAARQCPIGYRKDFRLYPLRVIKGF